VDRDELVTIDRFLFVADAELARAALEAAGIDAVLVDENAVRLSWGDALAHGGVRLQVRAEDAEDAAEVLRDAPHPASGHPLPAARGEGSEEVCSRCGSEEIFPAESRAKTYARIVLLTWLAFVFINMATCAVHPGRETIAGAIAIVLVGAAFAVVYAAVAPKMRCRHCGLVS